MGETEKKIHIHPRKLAWPWKTQPFEDIYLLFPDLHCPLPPLAGQDQLQYLSLRASRSSAKASSWTNAALDCSSLLRLWNCFNVRGLRPKNAEVGGHQSNQPTAYSHNRCLPWLHQAHLWLHLNTSTTDPTSPLCSNTWYLLRMASMCDFSFEFCFGACETKCKKKSLIADAQTTLPTAWVHGPESAPQHPPSYGVQTLT